MGNICANVVSVDLGKRWHAVSAAVSIVSWHTAEVSLPLLLSTNNLIVFVASEPTVLGTIYILRFSICREYFFFFKTSVLCATLFTFISPTIICASALSADPWFVLKIVFFSFFSFLEKRIAGLQLAWKQNSLYLYNYFQILSVPYVQFLFCQNDIFCCCRFFHVVRAPQCNDFAFTFKNRIA